MNSLKNHARPGPARGRREWWWTLENMSTRQGLLSGLFGISMIALFAIVLLPIGDQLGGLVGWLYRVGTFFGVPSRFGPRWYEFGLNVALFTLPVFFAALLWPSVKRWSWMLLAFGSSLWIEGMQFLFLPRTPDVTDVIANTAGAWIGVLLAGAARKVLSEPIEATVGPPAVSPVAPLQRPCRREVLERIRNRGSAHLTAATEELWQAREERS